MDVRDAAIAARAGLHGAISAADAAMTVTATTGNKAEDFIVYSLGTMRNTA
ncbi:MAG: hypothetical protein ACREPP_09210 [Rhodanobacteraceae bacterium]